MDAMSPGWRWSSHESVGSLLATIRRARRLTQADLAKRIGVSAANVSRIEVGKDLRVSTLVDIARALGFEPMLVPKAAVPAVRALLDDMNMTEPSKRDVGRFVE